MYNHNFLLDEQDGKTGVWIEIYNLFDEDVLAEIFVPIFDYADEVDILSLCTECAVLWASDNGYSFDDELDYEVL